MALSFVLAAVGPAAAQQQQPEQRLEFIRDAEIEHTIRTFATPIFEAAGIAPDSVEIVLIQDNNINAFVAEGMNLFLHTGLLMSSDDAGQVIGVIAHETGHIAGGHLIRSRDAIASASAEAILATILGVGAAVASGQAGAGAGIMMGGQEMARRALLSFSRTQEASADQAGLTFLDRSGLSSKGMLTFLEKLDKLSGGDLLLNSRKDVEYTQTHPLTRDRIEVVRHHVETSKFSGRPLPAGFAEMHARMKAKLLGFINPVLALQRYKDSDTSMPARYARAISWYRRGDLPRALPATAELIRTEPTNAYFQELMGQILFENSRVRESVPFYRKSVELDSDSSLLHGELAHALLETNDPSATDEALKNLRIAADKDPRVPETWRLMATAYGRKGDQGMLAYSMAEMALTQGDLPQARYHAERAQKLLPVGSPGWLRAQDIGANAQKKK